MRKAPLPADLDEKLSEIDLTGVTRLSFMVPGKGIVMEALANAVARKNELGEPPQHSSSSNESLLTKIPALRYAPAHTEISAVEGRQILSTIKGYSWIDWNDQPTLASLVSDEVEHVIIPIEIFERRGPARSNPRYRFGLLRSLEFMIFRRRSAILLGKPIIIGKSRDISLSRLVRMVKVERSRCLRLVRGVPFQSQRVQENQVLSGPEYERELALVAQKNRISVDRARLLTRREFRTISASPVRWLFTVCAAVARWIIRQLFSEVSIIGMNQFIDASRDAAVVLVPMHRSHLDYILVGSILYESRLNTPVVAAGLNLSFWPIGPIIRSLGAYFVRRNSRNDRIHSLVLKRYVTYLTKRGHLQEFFIEGGRSRSGRMRTPKLGLLSVIVDACARGLRKEILFIPVSISYENVVEERSLAEENTGVKKRSESLSDLLSLHRVFRRSYGEVVLQFGRPLSLSTMLGRVAAALPTTASGRTPSKPDTRSVVRELASALTTRLRSQSSISLSGLLSTALLCAPRYGLTMSELESNLILLARLAKLAQIKNPELGAFTRTLDLFLERPEALRSIAQARATMFRVKTVVEEELVYIPGDQRYKADFYRNSCCHVFFPLAVATAAQRLTDTSLAPVISVLHAAFEREFLLGSKEEFTQEVIGILNIVGTDGLATPLNSVETTSENLAAKWRLSEDVMALGLDNLVLVALESMLWVAERIVAAEHSSSDTNSNSITIPYKAFVASAQAEFRAAAYRSQGSPSRTEAGSQSNIAGGLEMLEALGMIEIQEGASGPTNIVLRSIDATLLNRYEEIAATIRNGMNKSAKKLLGRSQPIRKNISDG